MHSRDVIQKLKEDGWYESKPRTRGSHRHYHHPTKPGKVTVVEGEIPPGTLKSIERQSGLKLK